MSTYICEKCGCIDNTALNGNFGMIRLRQKWFNDEYANTHLLCSECTPSVFDDGSVNDGAGQWHNKFKKRHWSEVGSKEEIIEECKKNNGNYINAIFFFKTMLKEVT